MPGASEIRAGAAYVEAMWRDSALRKGMASTQAFLNSWGKATSAIGMGAIGAGMGLEGGLLGAVSAFTEMGSEMQRGAEMTGMSVEALSQLKYAAQQSKVPVEQLEASIAKMNKSMVEGAEGSAEAKQAYAALGLPIQKLAAMKPDEQLSAIADALSKIKSPTLKSDLAQEIFGKSGAQLLPLLNQGAAGIAALRKQADALGLTMSSEDAKAADELDKKFDALWATVKMGVFHIGGALAPALSNIVQKMSSGMAAISNWIKGHQQLVVIAGGAAIALVAVGAGIVGIGFAMQGAGAALGGFSGAMSIAAKAAGLLSGPLGGAFTLMKSVGSAALFALNPFKLLPGLIGAAGAAISGTAGAITAILSPAFLLGGAIVAVGVAAAALGGYFLYSSGIAAQAMHTIRSEAGSAAAYLGIAFQRVWTYLKSAFAGVKADALEAFGGIRDALSAGDWSLAAQILWAALRLEFAKGAEGIQSVWLKLKGAMLNGWSETMQGLQELWSYAKEYLSNWDGIKTAASKFMAWLRNAWSAMIDYLGDKMAAVKVRMDFADTEKQMRAMYQSRVASGKMTQEEVDRIIDKARQDAMNDVNKVNPQDKQREDAYSAKQKQLDDQYKSEHPDLVNGEEAARKKIADAAAAQRAQNDKELSEALSDDAKASQKRIDDLKKQLDDLKKKAANESGTGVKPPGAAPDAPAAPDANALSAVAKSTNAGTFSGALIGAIAGNSSTAERTAKATEGTNQGIAKLIGLIQSGKVKSGAVFS